jgi:hypothetical protein
MTPSPSSSVNPRTPHKVLFVIPTESSPISELIAEIENAMSGPPTGDGWSCFVSNEHLSALKDRGSELLAAIEEVVRRFRFEGAQWFSDNNLLHLLLIYFEKADDAGVDVSGFVRSLSGRHLEEALRAIFQIWGPTRGRARRRVIAEPLYAAWRELNERGLQFEDKEDWLARYVTDGTLQVAAVRPSE